MTFKEKLINLGKSLFCLHYITNILLAANYYILKNTPYVCETLFEECLLDWREYEILFLLLIFIGVKSRKAASLLQFVNTICTFSKAANIILYWREGPIYTFTFLLAWFLHFVFLPQPAYKGPENLTYFRGTNLEHEIKADDRVVWLVCFYAPWSPPSIDFAPIFAELSNKFGDLKNFRFAKLDVNKYQDVAKTYAISTSSLSKQLPTVILFKNSVEYRRRPFIDSKGQVFPFIFSYDNVIKEFDLASVYYECKKNPIQIRPVNRTNANAETSEADKKTN